MLLFVNKNKETKQNKTNEKTLEQSILRKSEVGLKTHNGKTKYMTNHVEREDILSGKSDGIHIPRTNHTPQRHFKRRNICQDQSSVELFWEKKTRKYSKKDNSQFTQRTSNGPMCLSNNDLQLSNMISQ